MSVFVACGFLVDMGIANKKEIQSSGPNVKYSLGKAFIQRIKKNESKF